MPNKKSILYFVLGQLGWFACVLSAAKGIPAAGSVFVVGIVAWHIAYARRSLEEMKLIGCVMLLGGTWETVLVNAGIVGYPHGLSISHVAPYWIVAEWGLFAAQLNVVYAWLKSRLYVAAVLGAIAGPLSFRAGAALNALVLAKGWWTMLTLAAGWSLLLPIAIVLARRWDGIEARGDLTTH